MPRAMADRPDDLLRWLSERANVVGTLRLARIGYGQSNITTLVSDDGDHDWILREPPPGTHDPSAHNVLREVRILRALADTDIPVPLVVGSGDPDPFYVMTRAAGAPLESMEDAAKLSVDERFSLGKRVISIFARLHALEPAAVDLADLGPHTEYLPRQIRRATKSWELWGTRSKHDAAWGKVRRVLENDTPSQQRLVLAHGDYRLSNLLVADSDVTAVLDWELATLGDPLADLAWLLDDWRCETDRKITMPSPTRAGGFPSRAEMVDFYCSETGLDADRIGYYRAFTHWRAATLLQGVLLRRSAGDMGEHGALDLGELDDTIGYLLEEAADLAMQGRTV